MSSEIGRILYVRCAPYVLTFDNYNLQEVGLGTAFCKAGYDFDLVYYSKENGNQVISIGDRKLTIFWRKGIKLLRTGIYPFLYKKSFLEDYDIVITSEYSQITSYLIAKKHKNVYLYNGPYYNLFKILFMEPIYDKLFCKEINKLVKKTFCKTQMSADYIRRKGITNTEVVGVGLDISKFENENHIDSETMRLLEKMENHRNILYVGSIIPRKNVELLINAFLDVKSKGKEFDDVQLILVGKGDLLYLEKCKTLIPIKYIDSIIWCEHIRNAQLRFVYEKAQVFMLPSVHEIFGMVLLEAMYFGLPIISSHSAGAGTLITDNENGIIVENFDLAAWEDVMQKILIDKCFAQKLGNRARQTIIDKYMWENIADKMLNYIDF